MAFYEKPAEIEALVARGELREAVRLCEELVEYYEFDAASCARVGEWGESSRAEDQAGHWRARAAELNERIGPRR